MFIFINVNCFVDGPRIPNPMPVEYLGRIGNRYRQGTRPSHPTKADFDIEYEHIPVSQQLTSASANANTSCCTQMHRSSY